MKTRNPRFEIRKRARAGFSMTEMLIVMAIMTVLAASLIVLVPGLRGTAMRSAAQADIQHLTTRIFEYKEDKGYFPTRIYNPANYDAPGNDDYMDYVLYKSLTDPNYDVSGVGAGKGWGRARDDWEFIRGDARTRNQFVDPWGTVYYYIPNDCYLLGVRIKDPTDSTPLVDSVTLKALPNYYGTTAAIDDYKSGDAEHKYPYEGYYGPPAQLSAFYNSTTFQIHSKGSDQRTDFYSDADYDSAPPLGGPTGPGRAIIDACDRGQDPDDLNNFGGGR